ncbi:MAG: hypothetical protein BWY76_02664 [bacterium ADurb.Bin429]|nr:MAG: hypothetical protein BWY76_02664 [bacterium ADurb.Bin429]
MNYEYQDYEYDLYNDYDFTADLDDALHDQLTGTTWEEVVHRLTPETPAEERVPLYQAIRKANLLPNEATFFLIAWAVETIANDRSAELLTAQYQSRFAEMEERLGLGEDAIEHLESAPPEYRALHLEFAQAAAALFVATFQAFGEHKMASLLRQNPDEFDRLYNAGYEFFLGPGEESALEGLWAMKAND